MLKEIWDYRQMIISLVRKDLRGRYKGSVLGFLWTFLNPLFQILVYSFVFAVILPTDQPKYYLFLTVALIPWIFFQSAITGGSTAVISQKDLVKKIYFPREVLPISYVTSCFVNMLLCFVVVFGVVIFAAFQMGRFPHPLGILYLIAVMLVEYVLALGIAMITSAATVYFKDLEHILGIVSMAWMYLTPVVYPQQRIDALPEKIRWIMNHVNPMTPVISAYRTILYDSIVNENAGKLPDMSTLLEALVLGSFFLVIGFVVFGRLKKHFAEEL